MHGFRATDGGYSSLLETWEREYLAGLLDQVARVLACDEPGAGTSGTGAPGAGTSGTGAPGAGTSGTGAAGAPPSGETESRGRLGETPHDAAVLASLDFDPEPDDGTGAPEAVPASVAPLLEVLLPDASEDPQVAVDIAALTRARLRRAKHSRLDAAVTELLTPTGDGGAVFVPRGKEQDWLGALNDVRLVLAERLNIDGPQAAQEVHAMAWRQDAGDGGEDESHRWRRGLALSYDMLTWWQESLVRVVLFPQGAA